VENRGRRRRRSILDECIDSVEYLLLSADSPIPEKDTGVAYLVVTASSVFAEESQNQLTSVTRDVFPTLVCHSCRDICLTTERDTA